MNKIAIGYATILGTIGAAAAVLIPLIAEMADAVNPLGVPPQTWAIISAALAGAVVLGRMAQAVALSVSSPVITEPVPEEGGAGEPT